MGSPHIFQERSWAIMNIAPLVDRPHVISRAPLKINCRCPVCGDSKKSKKKKRGYFLEGDKGVFFICHNCGWSGSLKRLIEQEWPHLVQDYVFSRFQDSIQHDVEPSVSTDPNDIEWTGGVLQARDEVEKELDSLLTSVEDLPDGHPVVTYIRRRKIPEKHLKDIWFATHWYAVARAVDGDIYPEHMKDIKHPRLVFKCRDQQGNLLAVQGRALKPGDSPKYVTIKVHPNAPKIWGLDHVNTDEPVFLQEGIMDCMFIDNSAAILGAAYGEVDEWIQDRVWVLDDEPRSPNTVKYMERLIDRGERVVCWDREGTPEKDINGKVIKGKDPLDLQQYLRKNIVSGLEAKLRIRSWRKC